MILLMSTGSSSGLPSMACFPVIDTLRPSSLALAHAPLTSAIESDRVRTLHSGGAGHRAHIGHLLRRRLRVFCPTCGAHSSFRHTRTTQKPALRRQSAASMAALVARVSISASKSRIKSSTVLPIVNTGYPCSSISSSTAPASSSRSCSVTGTSTFDAKTPVNAPPARARSIKSRSASVFRYCANEAVRLRRSARK